MAPEVYQGDSYDFKSDWWCLGITLYKIITGSFPFVINEVKCKYGVIFLKILLIILERLFGRC